MRYFVSKKFLTELNKLKSKKKSYGCIEQSLFDEFSGQANEVVANRGSVLYPNNPRAVILKKRLAACGGSGKSSGFRVIVVVDKLKNKCGLLMLYPKWGPHKKESASKNEWKSRFQDYLNDQKTGNLLEMKFIDGEVIYVPVKS